MTNENKTVEEALNNLLEVEDIIEIPFVHDRIEAAHKRELAEKDAEIEGLKAKNTEAFKAVLKRDALIKELANALECAISGFSREVVTYGEAFALVAKAREVCYV